MIRIQRLYQKPHIPEGFYGRNRVGKQRLLLDWIRTAGSVERIIWKPSIWKAAKRLLKRETSGKCAYCEAPAAGRSTNRSEKGGLVAHCDVEHFRPKCKYWWMAHNYENFVLSCEVCNQSFKGDRFPAAKALEAPFIPGNVYTDTGLNQLAHDLAPDPLDEFARAKWQSELTREDADLANPLHEEPEKLFSYQADDVLEQVYIQPLAKKGRANSRASSTINILGLNREDLRFARWDVYSIVLVFKHVLGDSGISKDTLNIVRQQVKKMTSNTHAFAGMVRYFVCKKWKLLINP